MGGIAETSMHVYVATRKQRHVTVFNTKNASLLPSKRVSKIEIFRKNLNNQLHT